MPPASRITDLHTCPQHGGGPVVSGSPDTIIGFMPAARVTDRMVCGGPDVVRQGSSNVLINHLQAARIGDPTVHGGVLASGDPSVIIGETPQTFALVAAAAAGKPFVEQCPYAEEETVEEMAASAAEQGAPAATEVAPPPPENPYETTEAERASAAAEGNAPEQRAARERVVREHYERHAAAGLGQSRATVDLGVGGVPPRANAHPAGFVVDLARPVIADRLPIPGSAVRRVTAPIQSVAELQRRLAAAVPRARAIAAAAGGGTFASIAEQLDALARRAADGAPPTPEQKDVLDFGLLASRHLDDLDPALASELYDIASWVTIWR